MNQHGKRIGRILCFGAAPLVVACARDEPLPPVSSSLALVQRNDSMEMAQQYAAWAKSHPGGGAMPLDFSSDVHYRVIQNRLRATGKTRENSPELFSRLTAAHQSTRSAARATDTPEPPPWCGQEIPFAETPAGSGRFTASSMLGCTGGGDFMYADVATYATTSTFDDFVLLASSSYEDYFIPFVETSEVAGNIVPGPGRILYMDSVTLAFGEANEYSGYQPAYVTASVPDRAAVLAVAHPREIQGNGADNPIRLCLYREHITVGPNQDCDYGSVRRDADGSLHPFVPTGATGLAAAIPTAATTPWTPDATAYFASATTITHQYPDVMAYVPVSGTYDSGAFNRTECENPSTTGSAQLFLLQTGGACAGIPVGGAVTGEPALPWTANDPGNSRWTFNGLLDFGSTCLRNQQDVKMTIRINNPECDGRNKTMDISPMDFRNSCVAEGTMVRVGAGKSIAVEKLKIGDKVVASRDGKVLTVQAISHGFEPLPMVRLRDDKGHRVTVTGTHPMLTDAGAVVAAEKLVRGDRVMTDQGPTRLVSVDRVEHPGRVFNFVVGTKEELASADANGRTLFANGFLVGDSVMQHDLEERSKPSWNEVAARLPPAWHEDYRNSLARKTVAAR